MADKIIGFNNTGRTLTLAELLEERVELLEKEITEMKKRFDKLEKIVNAVLMRGENNERTL